MFKKESVPTQFIKKNLAFDNAESEKFYVERLDQINHIVKDLFAKIEKRKEADLQFIEMNIAVYDFILKSIQEVEINSIAFDTYLTSLRNELHTTSLTKDKLN